MNLPIDIVPNTIPPRFRWQQTISTPIGDRTVDHEGTLPPSVEGAVLALVVLAKEQAQEIIGLRRTSEGMADRLAAQDDLLGKRAEVPITTPRKEPFPGTSQISPIKKIKGTG